MKKSNKREKTKICKISKKDCGGIYGLGMIGTAIYFISTANSFWVGVLGILKAIIWPAIMTYEILKFIGA